MRGVNFASSLPNWWRQESNIDNAGIADNEKYNDSGSHDEDGHDDDDDDDNLMMMTMTMVAMMIYFRWLSYAVCRSIFSRLTSLMKYSVDMSAPPYRYLHSPWLIYLFLSFLIYFCLSNFVRFIYFV